MNYKKQLEEAISKLQTKGAKFGGNRIEINSPISEDDIAVINMLTENSPILSGVLFDFYKQMNGTSFHWSLPDEEAEGGVIISTAMVAALRSGANEDSEPLEGVLYSDEQDESDLKLLKEMYILDSVPGRSDFITFIPNGNDLKLYLIEGLDITELKTNLIETLNIITKYVGCWGTRQHLTHSDWEQRIANDKLIQKLFL